MMKNQYSFYGHQLSLALRTSHHHLTTCFISPPVHMQCHDLRYTQMYRNRKKNKRLMKGLNKTLIKGLNNFQEKQDFI